MPSRRRLAAIIFTDIEGYTTLAHSDEAGAMRLLETQNRLVRAPLAVHHGRKIKSMGDGLLLEFPNARDAVECSVDLQRSVHEHNAVEGSRALRIRIGIHVGDVEQRGTDILGDAVNIASRIEPLAEAGGICLSAQVVDQVRTKLPFTFETLGPRRLKGIGDPVEVYRVILPWTARDAEPRRSGPTRLAVLPFANISPDPGDEYFADGLTEELITVLSQLEGLQVIARTSVIPYKSLPKPLAQIGAELAVQSVLEGSVRKAGNQLRITAQLIDVGSLGHIWASTYDRKLEDIFAIQADVAQRIASALKITIGTAAEKRLEDRPTVNPESYLAYLKGRSLLTLGFGIERLRGSKRQFELAAAIDPSNARAFSGLADVTIDLGDLQLLGPRDDWLPRARSYADQAVKLDPALAEARCSHALIAWGDFDYSGAEGEFKRALSLNPSYAFAHRLYSAMLTEEGRSDEALREIAIASELDPVSGATLHRQVSLLCQLGRPEEAEPIVERIGRLVPDSREHVTALAWLDYARSDFRALLRAIERSGKLWEPEESHRDLRVWEGATRALMGEGVQARRILDEEQKRRPRASPNMLALGYTILGDLDATFRILFEAVEDHSLYLGQIRIDRRFEPIRRDPRFGQLLKNMNLA